MSELLLECIDLCLIHPSWQTASGLTTAFLALSLYPSALKRAQEEIDRVVGPDRLPTFSDRPNLPYIDAIVKEALRWENVLEISTSARPLLSDDD